MPVHIKNNGKNHFAHLIQATPATARLAINGPDVGNRTFEKPSPNWKASTLTCLVIPIISARGDRKSTRLYYSHVSMSFVFFLLNSKKLHAETSIHMEVQ